MKLLLDENLSYRILSHIEKLYPDSSHVKNHGLLEADDEMVWRFAAQNNFVIVSKDADFHQRSLLRGYPPKFIYLRLGNCPSARIIQVLRQEYELIRTFFTRREEGMLILM